MKDLTPNDYEVIAFKDKILTFDAESDPSTGFGSRVGGLGGTQTQAVSKAINDAGNLITDIINARLDTEAKTILDSFSFGVSGAIQIGTYVNGVTGDIKISPSGIVARNPTGANTITVNGTTGDVTLIGTIIASAGSIGGWVVMPTYLYYDGATDATSAGMASLDYPFYAGAKYANRATAPFRVTPAGALTASSATITGALTTAAGSSINGTYLTSASVTGTAIASATITATNIANATITTTQISGTAGITGGQIASATITATNIANATITTTQISGTAGITGAQIASATITSSNISNTAGITGSQIASATITSSNISGTAGITGSQIASATITGTNLASTTITATNIAALTITASEIANLTITGGKVSNNTLTSSKLSIPVFIVSGGSFTNNSPIAGSVAWTSVTIDYNGTTNTITNGNTASKYIVWSSASPTVLTGASSPPTATTSWLVGINTTGTYTSVWDMPQINGQQIMDATVGGTQIANNTIQAVNIANGVITSTQISGTAGITGGQIASTTITATNIANNTITANQIANATLTATQIANGAVTPVKTTIPIFILSAGTFTDNSPIAGKVAWSGAKVTYNGTENTITDSNSSSTYIIWDSTAPTAISGSATVPTSSTQFLIGINSSGTWTATWNLPQVNGAEIQSGTVTATQIANNTITATQIANAAITTTQISGTAGITGGQIANNTITATNIVNATITATQIANNTITATQIANSTITASQIAALTITAAEIANLTITSGKINDVAVDKLTAGTITSKAVTLAVSDGTGDVYFNAGKTDFDNTQSGFILGIDDSDGNKAKFYIGSSTSYFNWDGSAATFSGTLSAASGTLGAISIGANAWNVDSSGNMWWGSTGGGFSGAFNGIDSNGATTLESLNTHAHLGLKYSFTAGENLSSTETVRLGYSTAIEHDYAKNLFDTTNFQLATQNGAVINVKYVAQAVRLNSVESITKIRLKLYSSGINTSDDIRPKITIGIQADSSGNPSGTYLASGGEVCWFTGESTGTVVETTLTSPYTTTANTTYWIVLTISENGGNPGHFLYCGANPFTGYYGIRYDNAYNYSSTYVMKYKNTDADSWTDGGVLRNLYFASVISEVVGRLYKADATTQAIADHYLGFVESTITAGTTGNVKIATQGIYNRGSLTAGSVYYLSDTAGAIGTSAGTISKKLGIALSTTNLYLY